MSRSSSPPTPNRSRQEQRPPGQGDETAGAAVEIAERQRAFAFGRAQLHARDEAAEILPAVGGLDQHRERPRRERAPLGRGDGQLGADDGADAGGLRGLMEARRAVDAVAIEQRDRRIAERRRALDERFRQRRAAQERKGRRGMKLDVRHKKVRSAKCDVRSPCEVRSASASAKSEAKSAKCDVRRRATCEGRAKCDVRSCEVP